MKLFELNETEFNCSKISYGLVLTMKRGQMSITIPVNPSQLLDIINGLKKEYDLIMASSDRGSSAKEIRNIIRKRNDD